MKRLDIPFNKALYFKVLAVVLAVVAAAFGVAVFFLDYAPTSADPWCAPIAAGLLTYFIHLMLWNPED
ncbi:MAG: hypothetical protein AAGN35_14515 [Bacteroidota bacterium]